MATGDSDGDDDSESKGDGTASRGLEGCAASLFCFYSHNETRQDLYLFSTFAKKLYLFRVFACTYFAFLHVVQKLLGGRRTNPRF